MAHALGRQLGRPAGLAGRLVGRLMPVLNARPTRLAIEALEIGNGDAALDIGFGAGDGVALLARRATRVCGIDHSPLMLERALRRNRMAVREGRVELRLGDFAALPWPDASFDAILAANVVYFWREPERVVAELRRVLRPGGRLAIYATAAETMRNWAFAGPETHRHVVAAELMPMLVEGGFTPQRITIRALALPAGVAGLLALARL